MSSNIYSNILIWYLVNWSLEILLNCPIQDRIHKIIEDQVKKVEMFVVIFLY